MDFRIFPRFFIGLRPLPRDLVGLMAIPRLSDCVWDFLRVSVVFPDLSVAKKLPPGHTGFMALTGT